MTRRGWRKQESCCRGYSIFGGTHSLLDIANHANLPIHRRLHYKAGSCQKQRLCRLYTGPAPWGLSRQIKREGMASSSLVAPLKGRDYAASGNSMHIAPRGEVYPAWHARSRIKLWRPNVAVWQDRMVVEGINMAIRRVRAGSSLHFVACKETRGK